MLKRSCAKLGGKLLLPKKSPKPRARSSIQNMWIVWICETVAYSVGGWGVETKLWAELLLPRKSPKPREILRSQDSKILRFKDSKIPRL